MLPASLICCDLRGALALPRFLGNADRPWIRRLLEDCDHLSGRPIRELDERLREPLPGVPDDKRRLAAHVLLGLSRSRVGSTVPPPEARALVFAAAARDPARPRPKSSADVRTSSASLPAPSQMPSSQTCRASDSRSPLPVSIRASWRCAPTCSWPRRCWLGLPG